MLRALWALASLTARNNDDLCRQIIALAQPGTDVSAMVTNLLTAQNLEILTQASPNYPGRGWGLAAGYGNSTLDTALALRALKVGGKAAGVSVVRETLAGLATSPAHSFSVPAGSSNLALKVRKLTGTVRFHFTFPDSSTGSVDVSPSQVPITINLPTAVGTVTFTAENRTSSTVNYAAEGGFTDSNGFDAFRITSALTYLGLAQNSDGGWGIGLGADSHLMVTAEVVRSLAAWGQAFAAPQALSQAAAWLLSKQNPDGGFSSQTNASNAHETSLAVLALRVANPGLSLVSAASFLQNAQLPDGSWGGDAYLTALAMQARRMPPAVSQIPGQSVSSPAAFAPINLDSYVTDADHAASQISWQVTGNSLSTVDLSTNRVVTITYPPGTNITEQLTFTATDPDGYSASSTATFSAVFQPVDYTIARGGSATGSRNIGGAAAVLDQAVAYTETQRNVPAGVSYTVTAFARTSATAFTVSYTIGVSAGASPGIHGFEVEYGLLDSASHSLGPLTNSIFNFHIQVTP